MVFSCTGTSSVLDVDGVNQDEAFNTLLVPAGVDSLTASIARNLADSSFVSYELEQRAEEEKRRANMYRAESDTLWHYLSMANETDSVNSIETDEFIEAFNEGAVRFVEANDLVSGNNISDADMMRYQELVNNAISSFEIAIRLNPFDSQTRLVLADLYSRKASRLNQDQEYRKAIDVLEKLVRVEQGEFIIYGSLGENYFQVGNFEQAVLNFERALHLLNETVPLSDHFFHTGEYSESDKRSAFLYNYYLGLSYTNLFDSENALHFFENSKRYISNDQEALAVESEIQFIGWDDGNILGSMRRDSVLTMINQGNLEQAETGLLHLSDNLKTVAARDEIEWRLSVLQYQMGKEGEAADRLLSLVLRTETNDEGLPLYDTYKRYFNDFGIITYNLGVKHESERNRNLALKYFMQSANTFWDYRARANLRIANLLSNNIQNALEYANLAEKEIDSLDIEERRSLYQLLTELNRRLGNTELARMYHTQWREL